MNNLSMPANVIGHLKQAAPLTREIENGGRRFGQYYDSSEGGRGYRDFCIYVQNGLAENTELFKEFVSGLYKINVENYRNCRIYFFGFGTGPDLQYDNNCIISGYWSDKSLKDNMIKALVRISGTTPSGPAYIPMLFPPTGIGNYFTRKSRVESSDLVIIIGKEKEVILDEGLKQKFTFSLKKHILFVEIGTEEVSYKTKEIDFESNH